MGNQFSAAPTDDKVVPRRQERLELFGPARQPGDPLNIMNLPPTNEVNLAVPAPGFVTRLAVCRCWRSMKFPLCDNTHQVLQRQGIEVGPAMVEIKPSLRATVAGAGGGVRGKAAAAAVMVVGAAAGAAAGMQL